MANAQVLNVGGQDYNIKDTVARTQIDTLNTSVSLLSNAFPQCNYLDPSKCVTGKKIAANVGDSADTLNTQSNCIVTGYIPVDQGDTISIYHGLQASSSTPTPSNPGVWYTDEDHIVLRRDSFTNSSPYTYSGTAPNGSKFVRVTLAITYYEETWNTTFIIAKNMDLPSKFVSFDTLTPNRQKLYIKDIRELYFPENTYWDKSEIKIPYESILLSNDIKNVFFKRPYSNPDSFAGSRFTMPDYYHRTLSSSVSDTIAAYDSITEEQLFYKVFNLLVVDTAALNNPSSVKNLVIIGDSFVKNGQIVDYIASKLTEYGLTNIHLIGTDQTAQGNKHEGHGGHGYYDYTHAPGTITGHVNPFWNPSTSQIDFSYYASLCGVSKIDYIICQMGINDMLNGYADSLATNMRTFFTAASASFSSIKVIADGLVPCSPDISTNYNPIYFKGRIFKANDEMITELSNMPFCFFAPVASTFDAEYAYPYEMIAPYEGSTETIKHITDYLHPYEPGYYMIAKQALMCFLYNCIQ